MIENTIVAISTALGEAGIGVVRLSGEKALDIARKVICKRNGELVKTFNHREFIYGYAKTLDGQIIDEIMAVGFLKPNSYTREDLIEIHCHGNAIIMKRVLETVVEAGAVPAEPGEFTKRAFLNGRIDLSQAEAVMDLISSKSEQAITCSLRQLDGQLAMQINDIRTGILETLAHIEVAIDLSDDDVEHDDEIAIQNRIEQTINKLDKLLETETAGQFIQKGIHIALVGQPNVGKSSLLNALIGQEKAIVTDIAGTTRDTIEQTITVDGFNVTFIDTAGLRETADEVEQIGVKRSEKVINASDCLLLVFDGSSAMNEEDLRIYNTYKKYKHAVILNKKDQGIDGTIKERVKESDVIEISALNNESVEQIKEWVSKNIIKGNMPSGDEPIIMNQRMLFALKQAKESLNEAKQAMAISVPIDILSIDIREAAEKVGEITGETISEELVNVIFSEFCVGK